MKNTTKILAVLVMGVFIVGIAGAIINEHAKPEKENDKKPEYNLSETSVVVYIPNETGENTEENLVKVSEITNLSVEDLKTLKHLSICHNEKQCAEMETGMTENYKKTECNTTEFKEVEDNPYRNPKPTGKAFGVKIANKTKE